MGVSKNYGTPKWMVYKGKPNEQMDDLGVPLFMETPIYELVCCRGFCDSSDFCLFVSRRSSFV